MWKHHYVHLGIRTSQQAAMIVGRFSALLSLLRAVACNSLRLSGQ